MRKSIGTASGIIFIAMMFSACGPGHFGGAASAPTFTDSPKGTNTPTNTPTLTPTKTPTRTPTFTPTNTQEMFMNIASLSNLKKDSPGYVDGQVNALGAGCGGGGGACLTVNKNNRINILFAKAYTLRNLVLFVGCNDGETMDGKILNIAQGGKIIITSFTAVGCGDGIDLANTVTDRIAILMTGGGGKDQSISVEEVEVYGR